MPRGTKTVIFTEEAGTPVGPFPQAVRAGDFIFVSGTVPVDPETGQVVPKDLETQTRRVFDNIRIVLGAADADLDDLVMVTVHLQDVEDWAAFNEVYRTYFDDYLPARMTFEGRPPLDFLVDVDAIAYKPVEPLPR
ncbi:RidA family protein [Pseudonocardia kunmingensis]|uniref:Endoribonuclease L-PSP n=1 Tax=Pseudonocardia kunmingensis TaxID=630975 RepID=A0A543DQN1_9PSEU|nr:Rid family detoxifying hydrolase [Pseudonocardia kunmingensis]TQM11642.1 endoribonuclease L-PSP [Pseudonocardia kunmingensis]